MTNLGLVFTLLTCLCVWSPWVSALEVDKFQADRSVSRALNEKAANLNRPCEVSSIPSPLTLEEMIVRVLCHDPRTRQGWSNIQVQEALVGVRQSAYLPTLNSSSSISSDHNDTIYEQRSGYSSHGRKSRLESRLSLSWVFFDFGRREAALRSARQLLVAASANQDRHLQEVFALAAQLYYDALAAQARQVAASKVAVLAAENLKVAHAKHAAGAVALADRLLAQTAYSQAILDEIRSDGDLQGAKGRIALRMGLLPQESLELASNLNKRPAPQFLKSIDDLLEQARQDHPSLIAAKAHLNAAKAAIDESKAIGRPSLALIANISDTQTKESTDYSGNRRVRDKSIGLQLSIPLFEGFERVYQIRGAQARLEASEAEFSDVEQHISLMLWTNYHGLKVETRSLERTAELVKQSSQSLKVAQGRYSAGVGNMNELLNALNAYAAAEYQNINTLTKWQMARLNLMASLGHLGFWAL